MRALATLFLCAGVIVTGPVQAAGDPQAGKTKSAPCAACHGADGNSVNPEWPNLAGQFAPYLVKQLQDFKSGARKNPLMAPMVAPLSPQDMEDLAAYFASQPLKVIGVKDEALARQGERLYRGGDAKLRIAACMACHLPDGSGVPPRFPRLSGQHARYVELQLKAFKAGERTNDGGFMFPISFFLSEQQIKAVAQYVSGLH